MRSVVFAYQDIGYVCLRELLRFDDTVSAVITHTDDPHEQIWFRSVRELASAHHLPVFAPETVNTPEWVARIRAWQPDFIFSFYYRQILSPQILALARHGALNLHGSLLPRYRGRCPVNWVLIHGERETGVTLHYMEAKADRGDIVAQRTVPISDSDTVRTLYAALADAAATLIRDTYPALRAGRAPRIPQDHAAATVFGGRRAADGRIDWSQPAGSIHNLVRAVTHPYPGAFTTREGRPLYVWEAAALPPTPSMAPAGTVLSVSPTVTVQAGGAAVQLLRVQPEGDSERAATDWAQRHSVHKGERLL